ncbi:MAG: HPF/RaiA family ribosome-associated protein [Bdellovibrionaceae bacterium]|nr:HPF/RaiA family ribosome-associated protein [Bdellovibrio sp.]
MKTNVVFKDFQGFEHLLGFVNESLEATIAKYEQHRKLEVKVIVGTTHGRHQGQPPEFLCEAILTSNREKNLFARKSHTNFHSAVRSCMKALERIIRRETRTKLQSRRKHSPQNFVSAAESDYDLMPELA